MQGIKCRDCEEYSNEWCKKVIDSPYPDMIRDCQYYHEKDPDVIKVIRCKDCLMHGVCRFEQFLGLSGYCSQAERREEGGEWKARSVWGNAV